LAERSSAASCACLRTSLRYELSIGHQRLSRCQTPTPLPPSPRMFHRLVSREPTAYRKPAGIPCLRSISSMNGHCLRAFLDRKSTRLNSSHVKISYAVFCLKKQKSTHHE